MPLERSGSDEKQVDKSVLALSERLFGSRATAKVNSAAIVRHCEIIIRTSPQHITQIVGRDAQHCRFCLYRSPLVPAPAPSSRAISSSAHAHDRQKPNKPSKTNQISDPAIPSSQNRPARSPNHVVAGSKFSVISNAGDAVYIIAATTPERANAVIAREGFRKLGIVYEGPPLVERAGSALSQQVHLEVRVTSPDVLGVIVNLFEREGFLNDLESDSSEVLETIYTPDPIYD